MSSDVLAANTKAIMINKKRNNKKQLLLTSSCTRNGNWGDLFGVAVLVNCFVRRSKNNNIDQQIQLPGSRLGQS